MLSVGGVYPTRRLAQRLLDWDFFEKINAYLHGVFEEDQNCLVFLHQELRRIYRFDILNVEGSPDLIELLKQTI